jgi:hypothetical protein
MKIDVTIIRSDAMAEAGIDPALLARSANRGQLSRISVGRYAPSDRWEELDPGEQHRLRTLAVASTAMRENIYSHHAAAAIWRIPILGRWPKAVDVLCERASGGRSSGQVRRHCLGVDDVQTERVDGVLVTSAARTAADLARVLPFREAVAVIDAAAALNGHVRAPLEEIRRLASHPLPKRGRRTACAAAQFATAKSESVWESASRVVIHELGFPPPILQQKFIWSASVGYRVDFWWPDHGVIGEFDGFVKYRGGSDALDDPARVLVAEKVREDRLRSMSTGFARWVSSDVSHPERLARILVTAGLTRSR